MATCVAVVLYHRVKTLISFPLSQHGSMIIIVAISGASGLPYGIRTLELLHDLGHETDLVVSDSASSMLKHETGRDVQYLSRLASRIHPNHDVGAPPASGSYPFDAMVIVPCSLSTASKVASGIGDNLITRAAAVALKERKRLVMVPRETPMSTIHLQNLANLSRDGVVVMPAMPSFYGRPGSLEDMVDQFSRRVVQTLGVEDAGVTPWNGFR